MSIGSIPKGCKMISFWNPLQGNTSYKSIVYISNIKMRSILVGFIEYFYIIPILVYIFWRRLKVIPNLFCCFYILNQAEVYILLRNGLYWRERSLWLNFQGRIGNEKIWVHSRNISRKYTQKNKQFFRLGSIFYWVWVKKRNLILYKVKKESLRRKGKNIFCLRVTLKQIIILKIKFNMKNIVAFSFKSQKYFCLLWNIF